MIEERELTEEEIANLFIEDWLDSGLSLIHI